MKVVSHAQRDSQRISTHTTQIDGLYLPQICAAMHTKQPKVFLQPPLTPAHFESTLEVYIRWCTPERNLSKWLMAVVTTRSKAQKLNNQSL
jgi:hypothetical protein